MKRLINPNFLFLRKSVLEGKRGIVLEGSSRSGKTWSILDFLIYYFARHQTNITVNVIKETYNSFKTTLYDDFKRRLPNYGIHSPFEDNIKEVQQFHILGSKLNLIGADKPSKYLGAGSDIFWINEAIHVSKEIFDQAEMRCRGFWILDYNPSAEEHWIYDSVLNRPDVAFLRTTFLDNPFVSQPERNKILSYQPNDINISNGTADEYMWKVYGLGQRAAPTGLIYKYWTEFEQLPDGEYYTLFAVDWGGNDPTVLIELKINKKTKSVYIFEHVYQPDILNSEFINYVLKVNARNDEVICDSARKDKINELVNAGILAFGATKGENSILDGIEIVKEYKLMVHKKATNVKKELNSYKWAVDKISGKSLNKPEDKMNHSLDALRYALRYYHVNFGIYDTNKN